MKGIAVATRGANPAKMRAVASPARAAAIMKIATGAEAQSLQPAACPRRDCHCRSGADRLWHLLLAARAAVRKHGRRLYRHAHRPDCTANRGAGDAYLRHR